VDGTVIDKQAVHGDLKIAAKNVIIRNSYLHCGIAEPMFRPVTVDASMPTAPMYTTCR
jgi:hypothetical protein